MHLHAFLLSTAALVALAVGEEAGSALSLDDIVSNGVEAFEERLDSTHGKLADDAASLDTPVVVKQPVAIPSDEDVKETIVVKSVDNSKPADDKPFDDSETVVNSDEPKDDGAASENDIAAQLDALGEEDTLEVPAPKTNDAKQNDAATDDDLTNEIITQPEEATEDESGDQEMGMAEKLDKLGAKGKPTDDKEMEMAEKLDKLGAKRKKGKNGEKSEDDEIAASDPLENEELTKAANDVMGENEIAASDALEKEELTKAANDVMDENDSFTGSIDYAKSLKIEMKDLPVNTNDEKEDEQDELEDMEEGDEQPQVDSKDDSQDDDEDTFHATVTDDELGEVLRQDEDEEYMKESRFVRDEDDDFVDESENAITLDEALRDESIAADDDGTPAYLALNRDEYWGEESDANEHLEDTTEIVKRKAWGPRIRIRLPRVRIPSPARIIRSAGRAITRTVRNVGRFVRRAVTSVGRVIHKAAKTVVGAVKSIPWRDVGKFIGKAASNLWEFIKCGIPGMGMLDRCARQAISSVGSSCSGNNCHLKLGGKGSGCLSMGGSNTVSKTYGPVTASGVVSKHAGFSLQYYFQSGRIKLGFYGYVSIKPKVEIKFEKSRNRKFYKKRIALTRMPKTVFRKLIIITIGGVPVPVLLEVRVQPVARISVTGSTSGSGSVSFELEQAAKVSLDDLWVEFDTRGARGGIKASHNLNNLRIKKTIALRGSATLTGTVKVGPEITVSINGIPLKLFPAVEFKAQGSLEVAYLNGHKCAKGSLRFSTSLMALIIPDVKKFTSVSGNFGTACRTMAHMNCKFNPAMRATQCFAKSFLNKDPCAEMSNGCGEIEKQLEIIPNPIASNPILSTIDLIPRGLVEISWGNMKKCGGGSSGGGSSGGGSSGRSIRVLATYRARCGTGKSLTLAKCKSIKYGDLISNRFAPKNVRFSNAGSYYGHNPGCFLYKDGRVFFNKRNSQNRYSTYRSLCSAAASGPALPVMGRCRMANWWHSFDKTGWSKCASGNEYMTGLWRNVRGRGSSDGLYRIEQAKCCARSSSFGRVRNTCYTQNWVRTLDYNNRWAKCKNGYFLQGFYRSSGHMLHNLEYAQCCKPSTAPTAYGRCQDYSVARSFDNKGLSQCPSGYMMTGLYRGGCNYLYCIEKFRCCQMRRS